jgi:hypothetical protein
VEIDLKKRGENKKTQFILSKHRNKILKAREDKGTYPVKIGLRGHNQRKF